MSRLTERQVRILGSALFLVYMGGLIYFLFFAENSFHFQIAFNFVLNTYFQCTNILGGGVGFLTKGDLKLIQIESKRTEEIVRLYIQCS